MSHILAGRAESVLEVDVDSLEIVTSGVEGSGIRVGGVSLSVDTLVIGDCNLVLGVVIRRLGVSKEDGCSGSRENNLLCVCTRVDEDSGGDLARSGKSVDGFLNGRIGSDSINGSVVPGVGSTVVLGLGVVIESQKVLSIQSVLSMTDVREYESLVRRVAYPKPSRAAVFFSQLPGPSLAYSAKVMWSVRGSVVDQIFQPAG